MQQTKDDDETASGYGQRTEWKLNEKKQRQKTNQKC